MGKATCLDTLLRVTHGFIFLLGVALLGYGAYLFNEWHAVNAVNASCLVIGGLDVLFGLLVVTCAFRSLFLLRLYALVVSVLVRAPPARPPRRTPAARAPLLSPMRHTRRSLPRPCSRASSFGVR